MVKAKLSDGAYLFGLSEMNVQRLKEGRPVKFDGKEIGLPGDIIIMYGETEERIAEEIMRASTTLGNA